jgi:hypothetical protein
MGEIDFTTALALGAGMLAIWLDFRLVNSRPGSPAQSLTHAALSLVALFGSVGLLSLVHGIPQATFMLVVLTVFLPALTYSFLAGLWMLRALADITGVAGR